MREVTVLCCSGRSIYKRLPGVMAFDEKRDARTWTGGTPVVAHPPCRCWSLYLHHMAKPVDREAETNLGLWCARMVQQWGGVLEQPAGSKLFAAAGLPEAGPTNDPFGYTVYLEQSWFGFASRKPTWVYICGVPRAYLPKMPFRWDVQHAAIGTGSKFARSRTMSNLAEWFVTVARASWFSHGVQNPARQANLAKAA